MKHRLRFKLNFSFYLRGGALTTDSVRNTCSHVFVHMPLTYVLCTWKWNPILPIRTHSWFAWVVLMTSHCFVFHSLGGAAKTSPSCHSWTGTGHSDDFHVSPESHWLSLLMFIYIYLIQFLSPSALCNSVTSLFPIRSHPAFITGSSPMWIPTLSCLLPHPGRQILYGRLAALGKCPVVPTCYDRKVSTKSTNHRHKKWVKCGHLKLVNCCTVQI